MIILSTIPHPTWKELAISIELLIFLWPLRLLLGGLTSELRQERNLVITRHVKQKHATKFKLCQEGDCANLQNLSPAELLEPEL